MTLAFSGFSAPLREAMPSGGAERALRREGADAPAGTGTGYSIGVGDQFDGKLSRAGDADWLRVDLQPGTYVVALKSRGSAGVADPYLRVLDANGATLLYNDDDGSSRNSRITLTVTQPATYYLEAGSYADYYAGDYSLTLASRAPLRNFTMPQIAAQLTDGYWQDSGRERRAFDAGPGDVLNVDLSGLTAEGRQLAAMALAAWEAATGLRFDLAPAASAPVHVSFDDVDSGAYSTSTISGAHIVSSQVNVGLDWLADGAGFNSYAYQTYIHEIGHALGLGHAGNYNGLATYGQDNLYLNDSWQATVMSYFSQEQNTSVNASEAFIASPMIADILAMRTLYGPTSLRTGNNTYGETTNAGASYAAIAGVLRNVETRDDIAFTVFDQGGIDLLDLSRDSHDQVITLVPGRHSSAYGLVGNISIAFGTVIEQVLSGRGNDLVTGNSANNLLSTGLGNDTLRGYAGNDLLYGAAGRDRMEGGAGNDTYVTDGQDQIVEAAGGGVDTVKSYASLALGANLENLVLVSNAVQHGSGNGLANRLTGNAHANILNGYGGNDTLYGGGGADVFVFRSGRDVVLDFRDNVDTLRIDDALWGGGSRSVAQVLQGAELQGGSTVLSFANGHSLTLAGFTNIAALQDDLVII
ncbi:M10 family metallopeptidase [Paracoccus sp. (in: a-proteobacteria)]|uniref:M10 family metallopeptidase n=1 Tax=Paracoccus sp. TaxID=267 RepID=UPI00322014F6